MGHERAFAEVYVQKGYYACLKVNVSSTASNLFESLYVGNLSSYIDNTFSCTFLDALQTDISMSSLNHIPANLELTMLRAIKRRGSSRTVIT